MTTDLKLRNRVALPDALRVLFEEFPREQWDSNIRFHGLASFWIDRHLEFRGLLAAMTTATEDILNGGRGHRFGKAISGYGSRFINDLHGHHQIEDMHYFPILSRMDKRITKGFDLLDADHKDLDGILNSFADVANTALRGIDTPQMIKSADALHAELARLTAIMDRHLTDEEELIVPVILKFGEDALH